jgi:hypothetical protein
VTRHLARCECIARLPKLALGGTSNARSSAFTRFRLLARALRARARVPTSGTGREKNKMGRRNRVWSRLAFAMAIGVAQLAACSSDRGDPHEQTKNTGKVSLALEATAQSGRVYRLRDALFEIIEVRTGRTVEFLSSEDFPASARESSLASASAARTKAAPRAADAAVRRVAAARRVAVARRAPEASAAPATARACA